MTNLVKILGLAMVLAASVAMAAVVKEKFPSATLRYKITVNIETPEGLKSGSAVREVFIQRQPELPESGPDINPKGEAVVVDLGKRGLVFALTSFDDYQVIFKAFPGPPGLTAEGLKYYSQLKDVKTSLKPEQYPMLVTFKDINDPKSVMNLRETSGCFEQDKNGTCIREGFHVTNDRFEEVFGTGVKVRDIIIEMTDEPVTWEIEKLLTWLPCRNQKGGYIGGNSKILNEDPTKTYLTGADFQQNFTDRTSRKIILNCDLFWSQQYEEDKKIFNQKILLLKSSAEQGNAEAQYEIGNVYADGYSEVVFLKDAEKWYLKSANLGNPKAMDKLSLYYTTESVEDYQKAFFWLLIAKKYHAPQISLDFDYISKQLTANQIQSVNEKADKWQPAIKQTRTENMKSGQK